jgi:hypothetical protein
MKFFLPHASDDAEAEKVLSSVAQFVGATVPPHDKRIHKLLFTHNGSDFTAVVGEPMDAYYQGGAQRVIAIFGGEPYKICLPTVV